jgi:hypothetical protein
MNWQEFNDTTRVYLIVDSERKGRGVQNYIDQMISASVIDMQRYVPALRDNQLKYYSSSNLVEPNSEGLSSVNSEGLDVEEGIFNTAKTRVKQVIVRRIPTEDNNQEASRYFYPSIIPWESRFQLIDGGVTERTSGRPGRVAFGPDRFWSAPKLRGDEALYVYYEGETHYTPIFRATQAEKDTPVMFDDMVAKSSADYVKAHLAKKVDNDLNQFKTYMQMYQKGRAEVYLNEKDYKSSSVNQLLNSGVGSGGFIVG